MKRLKKEKNRLNIEKDKIVKSILLCSLSDKYCSIVQGQQTAEDMWERLLLTQEQKTTSAIVDIQRSFFNLRLKREEGVEAYIARGEQLYNRAKMANIKNIKRFW